MSTNAFDTLAAARELEASVHRAAPGRSHREDDAAARGRAPIATSSSPAASSTVRLWIQAAALIGVQIAIATIIVTLLSGSITTEC